ncbi:MAG TPA: hypothetical protein HA306_07150 [Methanosarcina sp.]|nr:hypothetical protein [Methanosarcina sp.]
MKIKTKALNSIYRFAAVMMVLCVIPSGVFASENKPAFIPAENITEENFADVQAEMLDSISEQIAGLQSFYTNVSEASDASELQEVVSSNMLANGCRPDGMDMGSGGMGTLTGKMPGFFGFAGVESVTDENYTDVQAEMVDLLGNATEVLKAEQTSLTEAGEDDRAEELGEKIAELESLSGEISAASGAADLQDVVFTYIQTQAVNSLEMKIGHLEEMESNNANTTDESMSEEITSRITELNALIEEINGAGSLEDLMEIMSSSEGVHGTGIGGPMHQGGCNCPMPPSGVQDNNTETSAE